MTATGMQACMHVVMADSYRRAAHHLQTNRWHSADVALPVKTGDPLASYCQNNVAYSHLDVAFGSKHATHMEFGLRFVVRHLRLPCSLVKLLGDARLCSHVPACYVYQGVNFATVYLCKWMYNACGCFCCLGVEVDLQEPWP